MILILEIMNYIGLVAFASSGAIKAIEKRMDLFGVLVLSFVTALAGGITRDVLLGRYPPTNLTYLPYPLTAIITGIFVFLFYDKLKRLISSDLFLYADSIGLGAFTVSGAIISLPYKNVLLIIMMGMITAVGGGVIRDLLANEVPLVLYKEFYATASLIGGIIFYMFTIITNLNIASITASIATIAVRIIAIKRNWELPRYASAK
ncbi:MAG: trimeric intracellular cation channel family protein [Sulfolobaceae archaeon]|nr:trimeric intracellular cation channel family protein [Sulfolobaceae archaeon]